jgi:ligand-binding sensor domain-containing protein
LGFIRSNEWQYCRRQYRRLSDVISGRNLAGLDPITRNAIGHAIVADTAVEEVRIANLIVVPAVVCEKLRNSMELSKVIRTRMRRPVLVAVLAVFTSSVPAGATEFQSVWTDYVLTSWGEKDGLAEGTVRALAQDAAGYLWVGNASGLFRFDGVEFVRFPLEETGLAPSDVRALCIARDGSIWAGLGGSRGVVRVRDGEVSTYGEQAGRSADAVHAIIEDASGTIWAGTDRGLYQHDHGRWELVTSNPRPSSIDSAHLSARGDLLIVAGNAVFRRPVTANAFERIGTLTHNIATRGITVDSSGDVWVSDPIVVSEGVAGLHASTAPWFKARDVAFLGGDGPQDVIPSLVEGVNLPVHTLIIGAMGVHIFDQMDLEAVAETAARLNRWDFMLTAAPYPIVGGTGYPLNAIATF